MTAILIVFTISLITCTALLYRIHLDSKRTDAALKSLEAILDTAKKQHDEAVENTKLLMAKTIEKLKEKEQSIKKELGMNCAEEDYPKIEKHIDRLKAIVQEQMELFSQIDRPSVNSMHSRYKNELLGKMKQLDAEKYSVMRALVAMGCDPMVRMQTLDGTVKELSISQILALYDEPEAPKETGAPNVPTVTPTAPVNTATSETKAPFIKDQKKAKFELIQGGKQPTNKGDKK